MPLPGLSDEARAALAAELDRIESQLSTLLEERRVNEMALALTNTQIDACRGTRDGILALIGAAPVETQQQEAPSIQNSMEYKNVGDTIIDAVARVFAERDSEPMHYRELTDLLTSRGLTLGGKDAAGTLLAVLTNSKYNGRFERCGRGIYRPTTTVTLPTAVADGKPRKSRRRRRIKKRGTSAKV